MISICSTRGNMFSNDWSSNIANISGADTLKGIEEHCADLGIDLSRLNCCGCDGTNTNTGRHTGVIALLEKKLGRQLQRCICCLHRIELPFRHYLLHQFGRGDLRTELLHWPDRQTRWGMLASDGCPEVCSTEV